MPTPPPARRGSAPADRRPPQRRGPADRPADRGGGPAARRTDVDLLYGRNAVREALRGPRRVHRVLLAEGAKLDDRLSEVLALAEARRVEVRRPDRPALDELAPGLNHQGLLAEVGPYRYADVTDVAGRPGVVLALDHLQDPQNVGTLLRSALAFSAAGVLLPADRAAEVTPAVVSASAGATEHLAVARVVNLVRELDRLKAAGRWVLGLDTGTDAVPLGKTDLPTPAVLVVGAEGPGISRLVRDRCDLVLSIPISPSIDSLNAATAASIALYELSRQHPSP